MLTFMFSAFQSQGASVTKEPALHTIEREGASVTLFNFWKFSNVIFSNFPIQRIPVLVKNSGGIYRRCYFCLIRTPKVTKKRLSEHFCHRWWPKGAIALQGATVTYCNAFGLCLIAHPPEHPPYGRDQNESAHPPYGGCSRVPGAPEGEQTYFLVGNN